MWLQEGEQEDAGEPAVCVSLGLIIALAQSLITAVVV